MSDFTIAPDFTVEEEIAYNTLTTQFENGVEQRRAKWSTPMRKWRLEFRYKTATEKDSLVSYFTGKLGSLTSFTWTNPIDSTEYTVRFQEDSLSVKMVAYNVFNVSASFITVK